MCSPQESKNIQVTADALVVIRANEALAGPFGVVDPYARHFVTDAGKRMVELAQSVDPCYAAFNLARYRQFTEAIRRETARYRQFLFLGAGYDTRPISMPEFASYSVAVFEVDYPEKLASKREVLARAGVAVPAHIRHVPADLAEPGLSRRLHESGFQPCERTMVIMEGLLFFLPPEATARLLDPETLGLAAGGCVVFDYWSNARIDRLNSQVEARLGKPLFCRFPFPDGPADLQRALADLGYSDVQITDLDVLVAGIQGGVRQGAYPEAWFVARAEIGSIAQT